MSRFEQADQPELDAVLERNRIESEQEELERLGKFIGKNLVEGEDDQQEA